mmetsp:Transcript_58764/g.140056  ORF Transcript_58764/g.140056 Transcript_58764/m.140056 type:complete len:300 (-) Transcript_58764:40-939(-)
MAANTANVWDSSSALDLSQIRKTLVRMEDSIIFSLIERSQYKMNSVVYEADCKELGQFKLHQLKSAGSNGCLGDWVIYQMECVNSTLGRYGHPTEYSFFSPLPERTLGNTAESPPEILAPVPEACMVNRELLNIYRTKMLPHLCEEGDCSNHGSTAVQDMHCVQLMATRIYYGLFVAESKFQHDMERATALIKARDRDGLMAFITNAQVEEKNIERVTIKARAFSQNISLDDLPVGLAPGASDKNGQGRDSGRTPTYKLDPKFVGVVFRDFLMPLTKEVEVEYLLARLDHPAKLDASSK